MSYIFQQSVSVLCRLGIPEDEAEAVMAIEKIKEGSSHCDEAGRAELSLQSLISTYDHDIQGDYSVTAWKALKRLSTQDWWTRTWIIQEATYCANMS
jgi:hypothetical protein